MPRWSAGEEHISGLQSHSKRQLANELINTKGHLRCARALHELGVEMAFEDDVLDVNLITRGDPRPERHGAIDTLALQPLAAVATLQISL